MLEIGINLTKKYKVKSLFLCLIRKFVSIKCYRKVTVCSKLFIIFANKEVEVKMSLLYKRRSYSDKTYKLYSKK